MNRKIILLGFLFLIGCRWQPTSVLSEDEPASESENISDDPMFDPMPEGIDPTTGGTYVPVEWNTSQDADLPCVDGSGSCTSINWVDLIPDPNGSLWGYFSQNNNIGSIPPPKLPLNSDPGTQDLSKIFDRYAPRWLLDGVFGTQNGPQIPLSLPPSVVDIEVPPLPEIKMPVAPSVPTDPADGLIAAFAAGSRSVEAQSEALRAAAEKALKDVQSTLNTKNTALSKQVNDEIGKQAVENRSEKLKQLDDLKKERDFSGNSILQKIPSIDKPVPRSTFNTSAQSVQGIAVRRAQSYVDYGRRTVESAPETNEGKALAKQLIANSQEVVNSADFNYAKGNSASGDAGLKLAYSLVDAAINLAPIAALAFGPPGLVVAIGLEALILTKNWYEYKSGKSIWTGESLSPFQQDMALVNVGFAFVPAGTAVVSNVISFRNSLKVTKDIVSYGKNADEIATINNSLARAENIATQGEAQGFKSVADSLDHVWYDELGKLKWPPNNGFFNSPLPKAFQKGELFDRHGWNNGSFASPVGTPFEARALPPDYRYNRPYKVFEVLVPFDGTKVGPAAPWFGQPGLGTQYELPKTIGELIELGWIREIP